MHSLDTEHSCVVHSGTIAARACVCVGGGGGARACVYGAGVFRVFLWVAVFLKSC